MARREYYHNPPCAHEGCPERAHYVFSTRRDQHEQMEHLQRVGGWRCTRHTKPDEVLSMDAPAREAVLVSFETDFGYGREMHRFFADEGATSGGSGFVYGPGFKAYAKDFPAGTRLIVTARIETPASSEEQSR